MMSGRRIFLRAISLCLACVLSNGLSGCSRFTKSPGAFRADQPPVTLGQAFCDLKHDGVRVLSLIWVSGTHFIDEEMWCGGNGRAKYSGDFVFRVQFGNNGQTVDTRLDTLFPHGEFSWIYANEVQPWRIPIVDYNNDGQPDFSILDYGGCNWRAWHLFTLLPSGKIEILKVEGREELYIATSEGFVAEADFQLTPTGFYHSYFR